MESQEVKGQASIVYYDLFHLFLVPGCSLVPPKCLWSLCHVAVVDFWDKGGYQLFLFPGLIWKRVSHMDVSTWEKLTFFCVFGQFWHGDKETAG